MWREQLREVAGAPGEHHGGSFHSPVGWVTLTGQLEDSPPRENLNGKKQDTGQRLNTHSHIHTNQNSICKHAHTSLPPSQNHFLFNLPHNNGAAVYWPLPCHFSPGNPFFGSRRRNIVQTAPLGAGNAPSRSWLTFSHSSGHQDVWRAPRGEGAPPRQPQWLVHQRWHRDDAIVISAINTSMKGNHSTKGLHTDKGCVQNKDIPHDWSPEV